MHHKYGLAVLILFLAIVNSSAGQTYTLEVESGAYTELDNPFPVATGTIPQSINLDIPFFFPAFGTQYGFEPPSFFASFERAGFLFLAEAATRRVWICRAFLADLDAKDSTSSVAYQIAGGAGSRILKLQWKNMKLVDNPEGDFANAQIWLHESSKDIEIRIGPHRVTGKGTFGSFQGPSIGMFTANFDFDTLFHVFLLSGSPTGPSTTIDTRTDGIRLDDIPAPGTIYRFRAHTQAGIDVVQEGGGLLLHHDQIGKTIRLDLPDDLTSGDGREIQLIVYDMLGREALAVNGIADNETISIASLPAGVYHTVICSGTKRRAAGRLLAR